MLWCFLIFVPLYFFYHYYFFFSFFIRISLFCCYYYFSLSYCLSFLIRPFASLSLSYFLLSLLSCFISPHPILPSLLPNPLFLLNLAYSTHISSCLSSTLPSFLLQLTLLSNSDSLFSFSTFPSSYLSKIIFHILCHNSLGAAAPGGDPREARCQASPQVHQRGQPGLSLRDLRGLSPPDHHCHGRHVHHALHHRFFRHVLRWVFLCHWRKHDQWQKQ